MATEAFVKRAAARAGVPERDAAAVYDSLWRAVRDAAGRIHREGPDPRKAAGRVLVDGLGSFAVKPGARPPRYSTSIHDYDKSEENQAAVQQHRDDGEEV